jgi:hypothetical protein
MMALGRRLPAREQRDAEHAERQRRDRQARQHRVVLEHHLQVDGQGDHEAAQRDLLRHLVRDAQAERLGTEQLGVDEGGPSPALSPDEPPGQGPQPEDAQRDQGGDGLAALLPHEDAEDDAAHADHREHRADRVDVAVARVRRVAHEPDVDQDHRDDHDLEQEPDAPR